MSVYVMYSDDGKFSIDDGDDEGAIFWRQGAVYDQQVAGVDFAFSWFVTLSSHKKGGGWVLDQVLIEVELLLDCIARNWESHD